MTAQLLEENKKLVREYHEVLEAQDIDRIPEFFAEDFSIEFMQLEEGGSEEGGVETIVEKSKDFFEAFPDATVEEKELVAEGEWVLCRTMVTGTHDGEYLGIEPTGKEVTMQRHESYRIEDEKFAEIHASGSLTWVLGQLGVDLPIEE